MRHNPRDYDMGIHRITGEPIPPRDKHPCPSCLRPFKVRADVARKKAAAAYGEVPVEEFEKLRAEERRTAEMIRECLLNPQAWHLRLNYDIRTTPGGGTVLDLYGQCESCDFTFHHEVAV